ncbi:sulfotransferase family protein, partial [archaeon]
MSNFEVEVIGAGWGRTGTASLKKALEILGYPCYHMFEVMGRNHHDFWCRVADGKEYDFNEVFVQPDVKFTATVDFPSSQYWREQLRRYPHAKVILSKRDPEKWYKSCIETIFCMIGGSPHVPFGVWLCRCLGLLNRKGSVMTQKVISRDAFHDDWGKESILDSYNKHNAAIVAECPADK